MHSSDSRDSMQAIHLKRMYSSRLFQMARVFSAETFDYVWQDLLVVNNYLHIKIVPLVSRLFRQNWPVGIAHRRNNIK